MPVWTPPTDSIPSGGWVVGTNLGVPDGIPSTRTQSGSTIESTGDTTDRKTEIQNALNAAAPNTFVLLGAGNFSYESTITIPSNVSLRGSGVDVTFLLPTSSGSIFSGSGSDYQWAWPPQPFYVDSGLEKGSSVLTVSDTTDFTVNHPVRLTMENFYEVPVMDVGGTSISWNEMTRVIGKTPTTLTIDPPLADDYSVSVTRIATAQAYGIASGLEDMTINAEGTSYAVTVWYQQTVGCWIKNCKILNSAQYHVHFQDSIWPEATHCYFGNLQAGGSNHAGVLLNTVTGWYIYNNIFLDAQPNLEVNSGCVSGVFAYNYITESSSGIAIDTNHGPHNQFSILEGNYVPHILSDGYFGSERYLHLFRNAITSVTNESQSYSIALKRFCRDGTVVGNIVGDPDYVWSNNGAGYGQPNIGGSGSTGTASPRSSSATLTTRTNATSGVLTGQSGHGITTGQTLDYIIWNDATGIDPVARIRRNVTVGTVATNSIPFSGGEGEDLPSASATVYIPTTNDSLRAWWNQMNASGTTLTGTLTTRTSDTVGVITLSGSGTVASGTHVRITWAGGFRSNAPLGTVTGGGTIVPIGTDGNTTGNVLPAEGTAITMWPLQEGFQELDLDVLAWFWLLGNYYTYGTAIPPVEALGSYTLPDSLYLSEKPDWFGILPWPPYDSSSPDFNIEAIPAGYRFIHGEDPVSPTSDILVVTQVPNASPVTELWRRAFVTDGIAAGMAYYLVQHSGPYPTQPDNNFVYARFGTPQDNVYVFQGTISEAEAIASVP